MRTKLYELNSRPDPNLNPLIDRVHPNKPQIFLSRYEDR